MTDPERHPDGSSSRRRFLRDALAVTTAFVLVGCTSHSKARRRAVPTSTLGFEDSFGGRINAGSVDHVRAVIASYQEPYYVPAARAYVSAFPAELAGKASAVYPKEMQPILEAGLVVLYQKCTHLGCRVPWCPSSQYFECPCHDAKFDRAGEHRAGPAPRGLDHISASIENGLLVIDTANILEGLPDGTNTTHQAPAGPFCV